MNEKDFNREFDALFEESAPQPNEAKKREIINKSKSEFSQAFKSQTRPMETRERQSGDSIVKSIWRNVMTPIKKPSYYAFASIAVAVVAFALFTKLPKNPTEVPVVENSTPIVVNEESPQTKIENTQAGNEFKEAVVSVQSNQGNEEFKIKQGDHAATSRQGHANNLIKEVENQDRTQREVTAMTNSSDGAPRERRIKRMEADNLAKLPSTSSKKIAQDGTIISEQRLIKGKPAASAYPHTQRMPIDELVMAELTDAYPENEEFPEYDASSINLVSENPVSTFSIDVDTASYSLMRNQLKRGVLPRPQSIRAEELINYFDYAYPTPNSKAVPFSSSISVFDSPWNKGRELVHIGIKGFDLEQGEQPDSNLVFLIDVSGSMQSENKLPLLKQSLALLLDSLKPSDTISIATYAGAAGVALEPTTVKEKTKILQSLQSLVAGGSTAGSQGIVLAYELAEQNYKKDAVNRIIIATDGDFNVGPSSNEELLTLVERKRDKGVFLSVLGFGRGNYQDDMMQTLAQNGNGIATYIDTLSEAKKVLVDEANSTLFTIAKDVKIQVEFNPAAVSDYRLIGYETRALKREDFNNDKVDAGEIGAGHSVTAIYEVTPVGSDAAAVDPLRYDNQAKANKKQSSSDELGFLKIRYKLPNENKSKLIEKPITASQNESGEEAKFAAAVAGFAQLLSNSKHSGDLSYDDVIQQAQATKGDDEFGYRSEFIQLVRMAKIARPL